MKPVQQKTAKLPSLSENAAYAATRLNLIQLEEAHAEALRLLEQLNFRSNRLTQEARHFLSRAPRLTRTLPDDERDEIALEIAKAGGVVPDKLLASLMTVPRELGLHPDEIEAIREIGRAQVTEALLKRAIALHGRELAQQKKLAMAAIAKSVKNEREKIGKEVAGVLLQLAGALRSEYELAENLRLQDEALPNLLSPRPFPLPFAFEPEVVSWIAEAMNTSEAQAESWLKGESAPPDR